MATIPAAPTRSWPPRSGSGWRSSPQGHLGASRAGPTPTEAATELGWRGASKPGQGRRIQRRFGDGQTETWWAAAAPLGGFGPDRRRWLVVATTDPARLAGPSSWSLLTNLPRPSSRRAQQANLAEVVRREGLGTWVEQGDKQVKGELGWADFPVRSDRAIRGHWALGCGAFSFCCRPCWPSNPQRPRPRVTAPAAARRGQRPGIGAEPVVGSSWPAAVRAVRAWLALDRAGALLEVVVASAAAPAAATAA
jgi:hypothetical protein